MTETEPEQLSLLFPNNETTIRAELDRAGELVSRQKDLSGKLKLSVMLSEIDPDAFSSGHCKATIIGNMEHRPQDAVYVITRGDGTQFRTLALSVPFELWPPTAIRDYRKSRHAVKHADARKIRQG